ncbi:Nitrate reductase gamma subunit [Thermanaeromonas toyohensis ToBE]|uniref:Nitrate reductase gamma subunit n=1 Tax=Thermanaeromonas toyohensis ToBE TaxID=698762 RepID=A0A1W1W0R1_9FIRM|nr:respiratory nitrate reductase subunit gamma [Thermanaeromonas toyohensis]SMB98694.1 Nitrate reductase gamma subunit [Thermanaeromonas toyohensis ToBE]
MEGLGYLIGIVLPYAAVGVCLAGSLYKILFWSRAPKHLHWELFPYPRTTAGRLQEMVSEVLTLRSLYTYNRKLWFPSLLMHWGIYFILLWFLLLLIGLFPDAFTSFLGTLGGLLAGAGSLWLGLKRMERELKRLSSPVEYLNLLLIFLLSLVGLITGFFAHTAEVREYLLGVLTFSPELPAKTSLLWEILLGELFLVYLPFGRMFHFAAKYFSYHRVKWGEAD